MTYATKSTSITKIALLSVAMAAALVVLAALPSTAAVTTNETIPYNNPFVNPCNGYEMLSTGSLHVLASTTFDGNGFQTHIQLNEEDQKDTYTGADDPLAGVQCADTTAESETFHNFDISSGTVTDLPAVVTVTANVSVSCPDSAGSFKGSVLVHATVNPNGIVTASFSNYPPGEITCVSN